MKDAAVLALAIALALIGAVWVGVIAGLAVYYAQQARGLKKLIDALTEHHEDDKRRFRVIEGEKP